MSFDQTPWDQRNNGEEQGAGLPEFLLDPIGVSKRRWLAMVICLGVGLLATIVAVVVWKPVFAAKATLLITSQKIPEDFVRSTVQEESLANINAMLGEMLSVENLSKLIERHGLFSGKIDRAARIDLVYAMRSKIGTSSQRPQTDGAGRTQALVYEISYESGNPEEAAAVTNALAELFVEVSAARRNSQAKRATVFLREALERTEKELREQSRLVTEFRRAHRGELPDERQTSLQRLSMLSTQRDSLAQQIATKEDRLLSITSRGGEASETQVMLNELRRQLAHEMAIHTDEHPNVIALQDRIARLGEARTPAVSENLLEEERREIARLRQERARIEAEFAGLNQRVDHIPLVAEQLSALEQKEQVLSEDYTAALRKVERAELAENLESAQQGGQVSILDSAVPPSSPTVSRWLVLLAGVAGSAGLAIAIAVLLELIDPVVIAARQIEKLSDRPILGTVPHVG